MKRWLRFLLLPLLIGVPNLLSSFGNLASTETLNRTLDLQHKHTNDGSLSSPSPSPPPRSSYTRFIREQVCKVKGMRGSCCKDSPAALAGEVNRVYAPWVEKMLPLGVPESTNPLDDAAMPVNCSQEAYAAVLTGKPRDTPRVVVDVFPFAHELLLAEGRLWELDGLADFVAVAESNHSMRGIPKERHFCNTVLGRGGNDNNWNRWRSSNKQQLLLLDIDNCTNYVRAVEKFRQMGSARPQTIWEVQNAHRACVWSAIETMRGSQIPDDALIIFSDADEIPGRQAIRHLKHCEISDSAWPLWMETQTVALSTFRPLNKKFCRGPSSSKKPSTAPNWSKVTFPLYLASHVRKTGTMERHKTLQGMYNTTTPTYITAGIHITYAGGIPALDYKAINHAEGGNFPGWIDHQGTGGICNLTDADYCRRLQVLQDQPVRAIRTWEKHAPATPLSYTDDETAKFCGVPWVYIQNRERYRVLRGEDTCEPFTEGEMSFVA